MARPRGGNHTKKNNLGKLLKNVQINAKKRAYLKSMKTWQ